MSKKKVTSRPQVKQPQSQSIDNTPVIRYVIELLDREMSQCAVALDNTTMLPEDRARTFKEKLFTIKPWPEKFDPEQEIWVLNRMVRTDRTTGNLVRANVTILITKDRYPAYAIDAYVKDNFTKGSLVVIPMADGPDMRNTVFWNILNGKLTLKK